MAIDAQELLRHNANYTAVTGKPVRRFVCPITLQDDDAELCDGHILNKGIAKARRSTVIQRKDVDGYFGQTIESDLVRFLNVPVSSLLDLVRGTRPTVKLPSGEKTEFFFADRKARAKYQQVELYGSDGKVVGRPFLRNGQLEPKYHKGLEVEWLMKFTDSALLGSLLKSAYLCLFHLHGYQWVFDTVGDKIRRTLAAFYTSKATKAEASRYFSEFSGAFNVLLDTNAAQLPDTLDDGIVWVHYAEGDCSTGTLFAQTCHFVVNDRLITVTLPATNNAVLHLLSVHHYSAWLKDRSRLQSVHQALLCGDCFKVDKNPVRVQFAPRANRPKGVAS
jgi:hypothetical protein